MKMTLRLSLLALVACITFATGAAFAGPEEEGAARELFQQGVALHEKRDFAGALEKYRAAYARWPNPKILSNIGTVAWELGRFAEAAEAYDRFLAEAPADAPNRAEVESAHKDVLAKVGKLSIELRGGPAEVTVDGRAIRESDFERVYVDPGTHAIRAAAKDGRASEETVSVEAGASESVVLALSPSESAPSAAATETRERGSTEAAADVQPGEPSGSALPWIVGGIGVASLAGSGVVFLMRSSAISELEDACYDVYCSESSQSTIDRANTLGVIAPILLGVGVAGVGAAVFLFVTGDDTPKASETGVRVDAVVGADGVKAVARARF